MTCLGGSAPLIVGTEFRYNFAEQSGGGLFSQFASPQVVGCLFLENTGGEPSQGDGAYIVNSDGTTFTGCEFRANGSYNTVAGGMYVTESSITITDCLFVDNISGAAGGLRISQDKPASITGCTFIRNISAWSAAGAIDCVFGAAPVISGCTFVGNSKYQVWCGVDGAPALEHCILAYSPNGFPVGCDAGSGVPSIHHCFVFENAGGDALCGDYHDIENADPLFCDVDEDDLSLCADSPCLAGATWSLLVGAEEDGCAACGSAVEQRTWGVIKAMYR